MAWRDELHEFIGEIDHPAWGRAHCRRVYEMAVRLADEEGVVVDADCLWAASQLHDLGALEPYRREGVDHAERSAEVAPVILDQVGFPEDRVGLVVDIIKGHMFYALPEPWPEVVCFHDADVLDFMGAIGTARLLSLVGIDDWAPDLPAAIELVRRYRHDLFASLVTRAARAYGADRQEEMEVFLAAVSAETDGMRFI